MVSNISEMSRIQKTGITLVVLFLVGLFLHELRHLYRYGHLVPIGLHADVSITTGNDVLGVEGIAKIYGAKLTNYGILPYTIVVSDYRVAGAPDTAVNYVVELRERQLGEWRFVQLAGLAICIFFAGVSGYPFFSPSSIFHGDTIRTSM
jgi:hypothetical protein